METEDTKNSTESADLADLTAEATNEAPPAQSVPETIPPRARKNGGEGRNEDEVRAKSQRPAGVSGVE